MNEANGKVALVTGAGSGIGKAVALELLRRDTSASRWRKWGAGAALWAPARRLPMTGPSCDMA